VADLDAGGDLGEPVDQAVQDDQGEDGDARPGDGEGSGHDGQNAEQYQ
jgi:hypothetical protein